MSFENPRTKSPGTGIIEMKKEKYADLINDFGYFITLNASKLEHQVIPGKEVELKELREALRKPLINGLNYTDFLSQHHAQLNTPEVSTALVRQIYNFLVFIEPRLSIFKPGSPWVTRFETVKQKYADLVNSSAPK